MGSAARMATVVGLSVLFSAGCTRAEGTPPAARMASPTPAASSSSPTPAAAISPSTTQMLAATYAAGYDFVSPSVGWAFVSRHEGLASAQGPTFWVFRTNDGAMSWHAQLTGSLADLIGGGVQFFDDLNGVLFIGGLGKSLMYRTTDGGAHWSIVPTPFFTIEYSTPDPMHTWLLGYPDVNGSSKPQLKATEDGGRTWSLRTWPEGLFWPGNGIPGPTHFRTDGEGWFGGLGLKAMTYSTADGGRLWQAHTIPIAAGLFPTPPAADPQVDVEATLLPQLGVVAKVIGGYGQTQFFKSFDHGATWKLVVSPPNATPYTSYLYVDDRHWWAMGAGSLYKTSDAGQTWTHVDTQGLLGQWVYSPHVVDEAHAWAELTWAGSADEHTALVVSSDGGVTWTPVNVPEPATG